MDYIRNQHVTEHYGTLWKVYEVNRRAEVHRRAVRVHRRAVKVHIVVQLRSIVMQLRSIIMRLSLRLVVGVQKNSR